jgi:hypothetical protein
MVRVSLPFYLGSFFAAFAGPPVILFVASRFEFPTAAVVAALVVGLYGAVVTFVLLYKAWDSIQDRFVRTTPGRAVGFLFIPLFNVYWVFEAVWGFAKDYNRLLQRRSLDLDPLPEGLFLAFCILVVLSFLLRGAGWIGLIWYASVVSIEAMLVAYVCDAVNALPDLREPMGQPG